MKHYHIKTLASWVESKLTAVFAVTLIAIFLSMPGISYGQEKATSEVPLSLATIKPYQIQITYDKTSHLIFPTAIRYVDLGSEYMIAGKAEGAENVLRIKAAIKDFEPETNISVITDDGRFYSFSVYYSSYPEALSYDLGRLPKASNDSADSPILFEELGQEPASKIQEQMKQLYENDEQIIKHIHCKSAGIEFNLKGIYIGHGQYYFNAEIKNESHVPFVIDAVRFSIVDKKAARRVTQQERQVPLLRTYKPLDQIAGKGFERNIFLLDQFTMKDDQVLIIELTEKNGGRQQSLKIRNKELIKAHLTTGS